MRAFLWGTTATSQSPSFPLLWRFEAIATPPSLRTRSRRLAGRLCGSVQLILLLILLLPLTKATGLGIPVPGDPGPTNILLNSWSFTDTTNWLSDHAYAPVSFTNLSVSDLGAGTALVVDSTDPAWLQYNVVENDGTTNLALGQGSVMFWFAANWAGTNEGGTGSGVSGRLIEVGSYTEDASYGWWSLYVDPAGANLYFAGQSNDGSQATYLSAPIDWATNAWHLIALTYSSTNSALYIDGAFATNGSPVKYLLGPEAMANGFYIGSASNGTAQAHGMFDGLTTYANPLDAGTIAATYWYNFVIYNLNPMNRANWSSAPSYITNTPTFRAISGAGYLTCVSSSSPCLTNINVWFTNVTAIPLTNDTTTVVFTIMGGDPTFLYDVFGTAQLVGNNITNSQWVWLGQGYSCSQYTITNLPGSAACLILGTPKDSDEDGLTDAYELLVSRTDPQNPDTDGDGIWDWFGAVYPGVNGLDPYSLCPSGDGWTILQAYQNGWDPNVFYTPPPPKNVAARLDSTGTNVVITWESGGGPVTNYVIQSAGIDSWVGPWTQEVGQTNASASALAYCPGWSFLAEPADALSYFVSAYFTNGSHANSVQVPLWKPSLSPTMAIVRGPTAALYLTVSLPLPNPSRIRLFWTSYQPYATHWIDVDATNVVSGIMRIPQEQMAGYIPGDQIDVQAIATDVDFGTVAYLSPFIAMEETTGGTPLPPTRFVDGRSHLKENLKFLLQSATLSQSFSYAPGAAYRDCDADPSMVWFPETEFARPPSPTNYEYSGFHVFSSNLNYAVMQEFRPAQENYLWRNLAYDPGDFDSSGNWINGVGYCTSSPGLRLLFNPNYHCTTTSADPIPLGYSSTNYAYLFARWVHGTSFPSEFSWFAGEVGVLLDATNRAYVPSGERNVYGLALNSVLAPGALSPGDLTLTAGGPAGLIWSWEMFPTVNFFCAFQTPALQTTNYYFASQTRYLNSDYTGWSGSGPLSGPAPPLPGSPTFSETNTSPLLITGFGQPITVSGWAKQAITNGYANKYGYLEQYFTNAYTIDGNGNVTTNSAGLLSPYGEFFPMQPGPAALVTMPDIDPPYQRGTGVVNVIKLQLDVNHDGIMDLSFAGPDNTSQARPFLFWVNNDFDRYAWDSDDSTNYMDSVSGSNSDSQSPGSPWKAVPDYEYRNAQGYVGRRVIPCARDLEDFARLWVCGVTTNLLAALQPGTAVTLDWGDVGNPDPANPTIDLFLAADGDGGIGYLTNATIAATQVVSAAYPHIMRLAPGQRLQLNGSQFTNNWAGNHFIWCGVSNGIGALTLTVSQGGTNTLAQTAAYIQLGDIKQMYERFTVGDNPKRAPTNQACLAQEGLTLPFHYAARGDTNTPYILFVHGWNVELWEKDRFAERAFKRLYWQGYQGRFGSFRWPTYYGFKGDFWHVLTDRRNYDDSEYNAWRSARGLLNKLNDLNAQYPGHVYLLAHSMGNVVAGEALRLAGTNQLVNAYVATQAAVPAHDYDASVTNTIFTSGSPITPNIYTNWFASNSGAVGRRINFYNTNDYALVPGHWELDQLYKPDQAWTILLWEYGFAGTPYDGLRRYTPGSVDDQPPWSGFFREKNARTYFNLAGDITNRYEVMSYAAQPRSTALGRTPVATLAVSIDLANPDNHIWPSPDPLGKNYGSHFWHSAEFRGDYPQQQGYWRELLSSEAFGLE